MIHAHTHFPTRHHPTERAALSATIRIDGTRHIRGLKEIIFFVETAQSEHSAYLSVL